MKKFLKITKWTVLVLLIVIAGFVAFVQATWDKTFEAPYPAIEASTDSAIIARGKYLVYSPAHCATCHVPMDKIMDVENGAELPLTGGWELSIPPGTFRAPNLTPDEETGIGKHTDGELARTLRHSVNNKNGCVFPFMPYAQMSDADLTAIISFLRSQDPVNNAVPKTKLSFLGRALMAVGMIQPEGPKETPAKSVPIEPSVEYGEYVSKHIANCVGCHTERDLKTGDFIGPDFAGGMHFEPDAFSKGKAFNSPNLTPDPTTGVMSQWTEETFITRFKTGRIVEGSPMPWGAFSRMDTVELRAIFQYLKSIKPIENEVLNVVIEAEK